MSIPQTALFEDERYREDSIGNLLSDQFKGNSRGGRNSRFLNPLQTFDTYSDALLGNSSLNDSNRDFIGDHPLLWYEASNEQGECIALQQWECVVLDIGPEYFSARLHDLTADNPEEEAEFSVEDIKEDDLDLLRSGAVFYWSVGYYTSTSGQKMRTSIIKFRRLPAWCERELALIEQGAKELGRAIGWGSQKSPSR